MSLRTILASAAMLVLAACGSEAPAPARPPMAHVETLTVQSGVAAAGRGWDGVVEAVQQATLTAQTAGRVTVVGVDVMVSGSRGAFVVGR